MRTTDRESMLPEDQNHDRFYIANRSSSEFEHVTSGEFAQIQNNNHLYRRIADYESAQSSAEENGIRTESNLVKCETDARVSTKLAVGSTTVNLMLECDTIIVDATIFGDEIWVAAYQWRSHGAVDSAAILDIYSLNGDHKKSITIEEEAILSVVQDPWSSNKWIVGYDGLTVLSSNDCIIGRYWPNHRFDLNGPDVFVDESKHGLESDPLAILAYSVGESNFQGFQKILSDYPNGMDDFNLYAFYIQGNSTPMSEKARSWLTYVEPSSTWQRFACLLPYQDANRLCQVAPEDWKR